MKESCKQTRNGKAARGRYNSKLCEENNCNIGPLAMSLGKLNQMELHFCDVGTAKGQNVSRLASHTKLL